MDEDILEKAKRKELIWVNNPKVKGGGYHQFRTVGSDVDVTSSKYFFLDKVFDDPDTQEKYEEYLMDLTDLGNDEYGTIVNKTGQRAWESGSRVSRAARPKTNLKTDEFISVHKVKLHPEEIQYRNHLLKQYFHEKTPEEINKHFDEKREAINGIDTAIETLYNAETIQTTEDFELFNEVTNLLNKYEGKDLTEVHKQLNTSKGERLKNKEATAEERRKEKEWKAGEPERNKKVIELYDKFENDKLQFAEAINNINLQDKNVKEINNLLRFASRNNWFITHSGQIPVKIYVAGIERKGNLKQLLDFFKNKSEDPAHLSTTIQFNKIFIDPITIPNPYQAQYDAINKT